MACLKKRDNVYYAQYYLGQKQKRVSLGTSSYQLAKEKLRQIESALMRDEDTPFPTKTPIRQVLTKYVQHIRTIKTPKSAQSDIYYLRQMFGVVCPELDITSRKPSEKAMKKPPKPGQDRRTSLKTIEADCFEKITAACVSEFISSHVRSRGLAPKTANRYREIVMRLFNWSMKEGCIKMPHDKNPVCNVERYKENASKIRFLSLKQIDEQLEALKDKPQLQMMVAMLIYAGLRREELLWLTHDDIDLKSGPYGIIRIRAKEVDGQYWQPKTKVNRAVPISSTLRKYLNSYTPRPNKGGWFFPSPNSLTLYDTDNFSRDLREANKKANLQWSCLDYRHTFGSQLAMKGESLYKISTLLGNSPEICRKHYAALIPEALVDCVEFNIAIAPYGRFA